MLLTHVQAAPNAAKNSFHIQATGPAFPQGYASGDVTLYISVPECFIPSMRGSGRKYFKLSDAVVKANLGAIVEALRAPAPAYSTSDVSRVQSQVKEALKVSAEGPPKPAPAPTVSKAKCDIDEAMVEKVVKAVIAALKA